MNYQLLSLYTIDGVTVGYPRNFLKRSCGLIRGALEEGISGAIEIPFTSLELNLFLELLETRKVLSSVDETIKALLLADYFELKLTPLELNQMISDIHLNFDVDNIEQVDEFILEAGYKELTAGAVAHVLVHRAQLATFPGVSRGERFDRFVKEFSVKTSVGILEALRLVLPLVPHLAKKILIIDAMPKEEPISEKYLGYMKMLLPILKSQIFNDGETLAPALDLTAIMRAMRPAPIIRDYDNGPNQQEVLRNVLRNFGPMINNLVVAGHLPADGGVENMAEVVNNLMRVAAPPVEESDSESGPD